MINGGNITVFVSNMDNAVRFYVDSLGCTLDYRAGDEWAQVDAGAGLKIGLHPHDGGSPKPGANGTLQIGFNVSQSIEAVVEGLKQRGVIFEGGIHEDKAVRLAFFRDPDGHIHYLCEVK